MKKKIKQVLKSREAALKDLRSNADFMRKMKFTKEIFYPALINASKSVDDATSFLASINNILMESFLGLMKEHKFGSFKLVDKLDPKDPKYEELKFLLELFDDMTVFEAKDFMEGMKNEIQLFLNDENTKRPLSDLKARWIDEI